MTNVFSIKWIKTKLYHKKYENIKLWIRVLKLSKIILQIDNAIINNPSMS